jgi:hypothetical protein
MTVSEAFEQFLSGLGLDNSYQDIVEGRHAAVRDYLEGDCLARAHSSSALYSATRG